mmetsp:Transcript_30902/g.90328  ORF Transcript_30902/g.90328 Transcript_30902/m.90328 type:complete len:760 (+) Transcript_30902:108-2387(+)
MQSLTDYLRRCSTGIDIERLIAVDHIVQGLAGRHHGHAGGPLDAAMEQDGLVRILEQKFSQLGLQIFGMVAVHALDFEGIGQGNVIGVGIAHGQIPLSVEQALPVLDHHLTLVVQDDHLDGDALLGHGLELREGHVEGAVAVDADADGLGVGQLGSDGVAEADAHGAEGAGAEHLAGLGPRDVLGGHHLVDADAGGEEAVVHPVGGEDDLVHLLDDVLGRHLGPDLLVLRPVGPLHLDGFGSVLRDGDGILLLELGLVLEPRPGGGGGLRRGIVTANSQLGVDGPEEIDAGGMDEEVGLDLLGVLGLADVDVDDAAAALDGGPAGLGEERSEGTGDAIVEATANVNEEVALLHHKVGGGVAVHAQHVEGQRMALVEHPHGVEGGRHGNLEGFGERQQFGGSVVDALPGDDDGLPRLADEVEHVRQHRVAGVGVVAGARHQLADAGGGGSVGLDLGLRDGVGGVRVELVRFVPALPGAQGRTEGLRPGGTVGSIDDVKGQALVGLAEVDGVVSPPVGSGVGGQTDERSVEVGRLGRRGRSTAVAVRGGIGRHVSQTGGKVGNEIVGNDLVLQILGQIDEDGSGTAVPGHVEGVVHDERDLGRRRDLVRPLGDGTGEVDGRTGLEGRLGGKGGGLPAEDDEGYAVAHGIGDGCDEIGNARTGRRDDDAGLHPPILPARSGLGKSFSNVTGRRFVRVGNPTNLALLSGGGVDAMTGMFAVELVEEGQDGPAGVAVDDRDVVLDELGVDDGGGAFPGVLGQVG